MERKVDEHQGLNCRGSESRAETPSRRDFLKLGAVVSSGATLAALGLQSLEAEKYSGEAHPGKHSEVAHHGAHQMGTVGQIRFDGQQPLDPMHYLSAFNKSEFSRHRNWYRESKLPDDRTLREYEIIAYDKEIEIAPGMYFPAWTFNRQVPGPTIRANRGDRIRIWFTNEGSHPHTIHFHGWHPFVMDGSVQDQFVFPVQEKKPGIPFGIGKDPAPWMSMDPLERRRQGYEIYEFDAEPVGVHLYHCHSSPLKRHIHKGLYGAFIVDPPGGRPKIDPDTNEPLPDNHPVQEMVMLMNGFDTNFDGDNEIYAVNSVGFHYMHHHIPVKIGDLVRVYLVNVTEFDPINSFHLHAGFFRVYRTGTALRSEEYTDTVMMCQAERAILEFRFREGWPGQYMFHAHQSEFAELGWMGFFEVS